MQRRTVNTLTFAVVAALAISACARDSSTAPSTATTLRAPTQASVATSGTPRVINPLLRVAALRDAESVSATIGALGGTIVLPISGLTVAVPPFAVMSPTTFTVTADPGMNVSYQFEPHGLQFRVPLVVTQNLRLTQATPTMLGLGLSLGYDPDATHVTTVTELTNIAVDLLKMTAVSPVWHFSGYIIATGRADQ
jgi:hypothetical protein